MPVATSAMAASIIRCQLFDKDGKVHQADFRYDNAHNELFWIQGKSDLKLIRNTATELWGSLNARSSHRSYDVKDFRLDRGSGHGKFIYFRKLTTGEVKACKNQNKLACDSLLVVSDLTQTGTCTEEQISRTEH